MRHLDTWNGERNITVRLYIPLLVRIDTMYTGDILHISCFGQHFIILNSLPDAEELLERRANINSDRPYLAVLDR